MPGNHDVDRSSQGRSDALNQVPVGTSYMPSEMLHDSLMDGTFGKCFTLLEAWTGHNLQATYHSNFPYEYRVFPIYFKGSRDGVAFLGFNTALSAGRPISDELRESLKKEQKESALAIFESMTLFDKKSFLEAMDNYRDALRKSSHFSDDDGHLCFISKDACDALQNSLNSVNKCMVPVCFGHHPVSSFNAATHKILPALFKNIASQLYLCGHIHKPVVKKDIFEDDPHNKYPVCQVGVTNLGDMGDQEIQAGFSIGSLCKKSTPEWDVVISIYLLLSKGNLLFWSSWSEEMHIISNTVTRFKGSNSSSRSEVPQTNVSKHQDDYDRQARNDQHRDDFDSDMKQIL